MLLCHPHDLVRSALQLLPRPYTPVQYCTDGRTAVLWIYIIVGYSRPPHPQAPPRPHTRMTITKSNKPTRHHPPHRWCNAYDNHYFLFLRPSTATPTALRAGFGPTFRALIITLIMSSYVLSDIQISVAGLWAISRDYCMDSYVITIAAHTSEIWV